MNAWVMPLPSLNAGRFFNPPRRMRMLELVIGPVQPSRGDGARARIRRRCERHAGFYRNRLGALLDGGCSRRSPPLLPSASMKPLRRS